MVDWGKAVLYTGLFVAGFGTCYLSCVDRNYRVLQEEGRMYVEDKHSGKKAEVDDDFCAGPCPQQSSSADPSDRDLFDRVGNAFDELTR
jgi:hypothetical protein